MTTPLIVGSGMWHGAMAAGWLAGPALWPYWLGGLAANHALLTAAGMWPRSTWLGPNLRRLPAAAALRHEIAITLDDGPDPDVTPQVLRILRAAGARATFFCIGERLRQQPVLARAIIDDGHSIENHTDRHRHNFAMLGPSGFRREISAAQQTIESITGRRPGFFRAPAGLRNPLLQPVLDQLDLRLTSWTRRAYDTRYGVANRVLGKLTRDLGAGDILLLHDGHAARTASGTPVVLEVLPRLLAMLADRQLTPVTLDQAMSPTAGRNGQPPTGALADRRVRDAAL